MTIEIKADDFNKEVFIGLEKAVRKQKKAIKDALHDSGAENVRETQSNINREGRTGAFVSVNGNRFRASAPGEAPAERSGDLRRSTDYKVRGAKDMEFGYKVNYGAFVEEGTSLMEARPLLVKVANQKATDFVKFIDNRVKQEFK